MQVSWLQHSASDREAKSAQIASLEQQDGNANAVKADHEQAPQRPNDITKHQQQFYFTRHAAAGPVEREQQPHEYDDFYYPIRNASLRRVIHEREQLRCSIENQHHAQYGR